METEKKEAKLKPGQTRTHDLALPDPHWLAIYCALLSTGGHQPTAAREEADKAYADLKAHGRI